MIVKVHPHRTKVLAGKTRCVSVTPIDGHAYYMGTVILGETKFVIHQSGLKRAQEEQVRNVHAWAVGKLLREDEEIYPPLKPEMWTKVTYHYDSGRFFSLLGRDLTDGVYSRAYFAGKDFYVLED